jgi:peptidoglycan/LPS O-acetylase OafA/YrhL
MDESSPIRSVFRYGWSGVEVFFVISGFVIPYSLLGTNFRIANFGAFLKKRLVRIEPAYLVSIVVVIVLNYLSSLLPGYQGDSFGLSPMRLVLHVGYLVDIFGSEWLNPAYWTLAVELQYYLVIGILIATWNIKNKYLTLTTLVIFLGMSFSGLNIIKMFDYTDIFTLGILCAFYKKEWISQHLFLGSTAVVAFTIFMNHEVVIFIVTTLCSLLIAFGERLFYSKPLLFLGNISYSLYLLHTPIGGKILNYSKRFDVDEFSKALIVVLALSVSIAVSWVFYMLVEKPSHVWAKKIKFN